MATNNKSADNRTMATDAVATIGMLIPEDAGRDAIHLATEPVIAGEKLHAGQHIGFLPDGTVGTAATELLGIVDPFLTSPVFPGNRFWLVVYPRTITSLRHVWTHPAFAQTETVLSHQGSALPDTKEESKAWLEDFARRLFSYTPDEEYGSSLDQLISGLEYGGSFGTDIEYGDDLVPSDELYFHYERYTGKPAPKRAEYFRCAC